jgi:hypothetical protein
VAGMMISKNAVFPAEAEGLDLTQVYVLYNNLNVDPIPEYYPTHVCLSLVGFHMQEAWLVLSSPWKPLVITSNNTLEPFVELTYDSATMNENPIANTSEKFAWDYDSINKLIFIKLLLTARDSRAVVKVTLYYAVLAQFLEFKLNKLNYSVTEPIDVYATISANYILKLTFHWLIEILIFENATGALYQKGSEEFDLEADQTKTVHYQFKPITVPGNYSTVARLIDPRNNNVVVASSEIFFTVSGPPKPPPSQIVFPEWLKFLMIAIVIVAASIGAYKKLRKRIHIKRQESKPK